MTKATDDGWKRHDDEQRGAWMKLTPAERLAWLEEAKRFAEAAKHARRNHIYTVSGVEFGGTDPFGCGH